MEGIQHVGIYARSAPTHQQGHFYKRCGCERVGHRDEGGNAAAFFAGAIRVVLHHAHLDFCGCFGCAYRGNGAGYQDYEHRAVKDGFVHHSCAVGEHHVIAYCDHGKCHGGVCGGEAEHHAPVGGFHIVDFLCGESGNPFAG